MTIETLVNVAVPIEALVRAVNRNPDHHVVSRIQTMDRREILGFRTSVLRGVCIDVETTGLDPNEDRIIELALQTFQADAHGRIVETGLPMSWLEDPGTPISAEITQVTGLRSEDLKGRGISDGEASGLIGGADIVIAHNAAFDRRFVEKRLPYVAGRRWGCSLADVDWRALGFEGRSLHHLLMQTGWFYHAHRAQTDVSALLHLLDHRLTDGETVLFKLLQQAERPDWIIEVRDPPRDKNRALKARGYRWESTRAAWRRRASDMQVDEEMEWGTVHVFNARRSPDRFRQDWTTRYGDF